MYMQSIKDSDLYHLSHKLPILLSKRPSDTSVPKRNVTVKHIDDILHSSRQRVQHDLPELLNSLDPNKKVEM